MARPPLGLGKHGSIRVTREGGQWVARCRFRQLNGATVRVERWASSKTAATHNLQDELRNRAGERTTMLSASSRFADAAEIYLAKIAERREGSTYDIYRYWMERRSATGGGRATDPRMRRRPARCVLHRSPVAATMLIPPPAPTAASCRWSPVSSSFASAASAWSRIAARSGVFAVDDSSTTTRALRETLLGTQPLRHVARGKALRGERIGSDLRRRETATPLVRTTP